MLKRKTLISVACAGIVCVILGALFWYKRGWIPHSSLQRKVASNSENGEEKVQWVIDTTSLPRAQDHCEVVKIIAEKALGPRAISITGQGSVFVSQFESDKTFVLTAAHVVANSKRIKIECNDKSYGAVIRGMSSTKDLAVLELDQAVAGIYPLFKWDGTSLPVPEVFHELSVADENYIPRGTYLIQASSDIFDSSQLHWVRISKSGIAVIPNRYSVQVQIAPRPADHPLIGSQNALILTKQGIRPGMSGSPVLYQVYPSGETYLSGVLLKTYINNTQSVAIPVEAISAALPELLAGKDPAQEPGSNYLFQKRLVESSQGLSELPEILFRSENGGELLRSVCPGPFSNSSGVFGGDVGGKGAGGDGGGKGAGGDGGGSGNGFGNGQGKFADSGGYLQSDSYSLYRDHYGCKEAGIQDAKGSVYVALRKKGGGVYKTDSFDNVSEFIQQEGRNFPLELAKKGIKAQDASEALHLLCQDRALFLPSGQSERVLIVRRDFKPRDLDAADEFSEIQFPYGKDQKVECDPGKNIIQLQVSYKDFSAKLSIAANTWSGIIRFKGCESKLSNAPKTLWAASYRDQVMDLQMSLSPNQDLIDFDIFSLAQECNTGKQYASNLIQMNRFEKDPKGVWLSKVSIRLPHPTNLDGVPQSKAEAAIDQWENGELSAAAEEKKRLSDEDQTLANQALAVLPRDVQKAKETLQVLHQREIDELSRARFGELVSRRRVEILRSLRALIESRMLR